MKRLKLLGAMLALLALIALVIVYASPYAPVVQPVMDIEEIWAIEDTREESETPLVTALELSGMPLARDAEANRFYCTLGLDHAEEWPQMHLTAPGAKGVSIVFVDDYSYDWCSDAIRDGYGYQLMAYTDTAYHYFEIVFTGLPQLSIKTSGELTREDSPVTVSAAGYGEAPLAATGRIHLRGASTMLFEKKSYKLEFTRERNGYGKKIGVVLPGFGETDDIALLPCVHEREKMRDKLSWDLYAMIAADGESFGARRAEYVELFVDDAYAGVYLMVEPVDIAYELGLEDSRRTETDSVYRTAALNFSKDREYVKHPFRSNAGYELYYAPAGGEPFGAIGPYIDLLREEDDEVFIEKALQMIDLDSMLRYVLFVQAGGMTDNFFNNMYIWAHPQGGSVTYRFAPWDLDMTWGRMKEDIGEEFENWLHFPLADRMINLNAGNSRQRLYDMWQEMRKTVFSEETLEARIQEYIRQLGDSGALARDAERWGTDMYYPDGYEIISFAAVRYPLIDAAVELIAGNGGEPVSFLTNSEYERKGGTMLPDLPQ